MPTSELGGEWSWCASALRLAPGTIHQKVFEDERAFSTVKRSPALAAAKLLVRQSLVRFDADEFVLRRAVRALERRCFGNWHSFGAV